MTGTVDSGLDLRRVKQEWPDLPDGSMYLNTGSCGRKPRCVVSALENSWQELNLNPTIYTFFKHEETLETARQAAANLFSVHPENLMLLQNAVQGLQLVLQSFLLEPDDELVTTTHEHGSYNAQVQHLERTRGIKVRRHQMKPMDGSASLCRGILDLVTDRTRLVEVSEIDCYTGWKPDLSELVAELKRANIPLLVDGAHVPGQVQGKPGDYPLWVGSGHKWLGGPNGTGFLHVAPQLVPQLKPMWVADPPHYPYFEGKPFRVLEYQGTTDISRWVGLAAACNLQKELKPERVMQRHHELARYLRKKLQSLPGANIRTPDLDAERTGIVTVSWEKQHVKVAHLQTALWESYHMWLQPDFYYGEPAHGLRVSCHVSVSEEDLDRFVQALSQLVEIFS